MKLRLPPELQDYSQAQWTEITEQLPAVSKYREWTTRTPAPEDDGQQLRWQRHCSWLRAALATYFDTIPTLEICHFWSTEAERFLETAWKLCGLHSQPVCLIGIGKLGAHELNLSSDVDLIVVSDVGLTPEIDRSLKRFRTLLAEPTDLGFVLRLDFDLRPGGRFGPLISTLPQLEDYYWSQGETWERLALVRARPLLGPRELCRSIEDTLSQFTYRKFLDYTLLDDLKQMRSRIHQHYQLTTADEFHLKAGIGGIRDIELFVHALQVLHGGKDRSLRTHSTQKALLYLQDRQILPAEEVKILETSYWLFRHIEHLVQIKEDRQSHILQIKNPPKGHRNCDEETIRRFTSSIDGIVSSLLGPAASHEESLPSSLSGQQKWLTELGFSETSVQDVWPQLMSQTARSTRRERDEKARRLFLFHFISETAKSGLDKDLGISLLVKFTQSIRAKATFFSLFAREPRIVKDLARLFSSSPYLGSILASRPELIDGFIFRFHEHFSEDLESRLEEMAEYRLLTEIIAANQFLYDKNSNKLNQNLSDCADYICTELMNSLDGRSKDQALKVLAMGKWGGRELGFRSDLDLVFVSPNSPTAADHRIGKRFINRLSDVHKGGRIYSIDLRLRPSGSSGPLIVSQDGLKEFLTERAEPWERQAYLKARPLNGPLPFSPADLCAQRSLASSDLDQLREIRSKLLKPCSESATEIKYNPGGLIDTELALQTLILKSNASTCGPSVIEMSQCIQALNPDWKESIQILLRNYIDLRSAEQMLQLASNHSGSKILYSTQEAQRLAQLLDTEPTQLHQRLSHLMLQSTEILKDLDPIMAPS